MGVGTRSPWTTTGGSYDGWRSVISKDLWLLRCSRLHLAQIAMILIMITRIRTSAKNVWSPLRLLCIASATTHTGFFQKSLRASDRAVSSRRFEGVTFKA